MFHSCGSYKRVSGLGSVSLFGRFSLFPSDRVINASLKCSNSEKKLAQQRGLQMKPGYSGQGI